MSQYGYSLYNNATTQQFSGVALQIASCIKKSALYKTKSMSRSLPFFIRHFAPVI